MTQDAGGDSVPPAVRMDLGGLQFNAKPLTSSGADAIRDARILQLEQRADYLVQALTELWGAHMALAQSFVLLAHQRTADEAIN